MSKRTLLIGTALAVILASGAWYFFTEPHSVALPAVPAGAGPSGTTTVRALLSLPGDLECAITLPNHHEGVAYVSGAKLYALFSAAAGVGRAYVLYDGSSFYTWADGFAKGTALSDAAGASSEAIEHTDVTYRCVPWTPVQSFFIPPANVQFTPVSPH